MCMLLVNVKWQKEKFSDIDCNTDESPTVFKAMLYSLTGVPPDRQKVMLPGKILGNENFDGVKLKDGLTIMLVGSADKLPTADVKSYVENEVPAETEEALKLPHGLVNLGNTCYMNATVQLLYSIPELRLALYTSSFSKQSMGRTPSHSLCASLKLLFSTLDKAVKAVTPTLFLSCLYNVCPQFATRSSDPLTDKLDAQSSLFSMMGGGFDQQDASECWAELVRALHQVTIEPQDFKAAQDLPDSFGTLTSWNPIDRFFTGRLDCKFTCTESDEVPTESSESFTQLSCFMNQEVKYLLTGIRNGFEGTVTKHSSSLNRDAVYRRASQISRLPGYMCIQFVRFFYKEDKKINAKILKDVKFPLSLDMHEFCTKDLQAKLLPMREKIRIQEEREVMSSSKQCKLGSLSENKSDPYCNMELYEPYWFSDDPGSNNSGYYELQGVLSHQGRTSASGHYVAWVKRNGMWLKFDDHRVTQVTEENILRLSGGGDWHCAYILLYGPRWVKKDSDVSTEINELNSTAVTKTTNSDKTTVHEGDHLNN